MSRYAAAADIARADGPIPCPHMNAGLIKRKQVASLVQHQVNVPILVEPGSSCGKIFSPANALPRKRRWK